jgi:Kef-type K+ transport system membrane component KefB
VLPDIRTLLLQIVVICTLARALGWCFGRIRQPRVVGEIAAGILLGPSFLGWLFPSFSHFVFPSDSLGPLYALSQLGLLLFMFEVGLALEMDQVRNAGPAVVVTSNVSVLVPLASGAALAVYLYPRLADKHVGITSFALFLGTAMSITAFPVLARILRESRVVTARIASIAIACAAVDDVTAWCLLALLVATVRAGAGTHVWLTLSALAAYLFVMIAGVRPLLRRIPLFDPSVPSRNNLALLLGFVFLSSWTTEWIGVHALFGAFFAGVVLPKNSRLIQSVSERLEAFTTVLLLPLFFAFTGLRTSVGLLHDWKLWGFCALIIAVAVLGKLLGCALPARAIGVSWREALTLGILLNTRGLVELVILNIGLDLGVINPTVFSMMVIMALVTTFMTSPLLSVVHPKPKAIAIHNTA